MSKSEYKVRPHEGQYAVFNVTKKRMVSTHPNREDAVTAMLRIKKHRRDQ